MRVSLRKSRALVGVLAALAGAGCGARPALSHDASPSDVAPDLAPDGRPPDLAPDGRPPDFAPDTPDMPDAADAPDSADAPALASDAPDADGATADGDASPLDAAAAYVAAVESFCAERSRRQCARDVRCHLANASPADCVLDATKSCRAELEGWQVSAAARGQLAVDAAGMAACLAALDEATCDQSQGGGDCTHILAPSAADGAPCAHAEECRGGFCDLPFYGACRGTCGSLPGAGSPCRADSHPPCDPASAVCDVATHTCVPLRPRGAACTAGDQCAPADFCQRPRGADCAAAAGGEPPCRCTLRRAAGQSCATYVDCEPGLACLGGACRGPGGRGDPCNFELPRPCVGALVCVVTSDAVGAPAVCGDRLPADAACSSKVCQPGLKCAQRTGGLGGPGYCRPLFPTGHVCDVIDDCAVDAFCDEAKTCQPRPREGEDCSHGEAGGRAPCWGVNLVCADEIDLDVDPATVSRVCQPPPRLGLGQLCGLFRCAPGLICWLGHCITPTPAGSFCEDSDVPNECASGICRVTEPRACDAEFPFLCPGLCTEVCSDDGGA